MASSLTDLVCLPGGRAVPRFVVELVMACEWFGIRLSVVDGEVVASCPECPEAIDAELLEDLRAWKWPLVTLLQHTPNDRRVSA